MKSQNSYLNSASSELRGAIVVNHTIAVASSVCLAVLRESFAAFLASLSAILSSRVGTGGLSPIGVPNGAIICFTTCRLCRDVGQPGTIEITSPVRNEEFGSWTK